MSCNFKTKIIALLLCLALPVIGFCAGPADGRPADGKAKNAVCKQTQECGSGLVCLNISPNVKNCM